MEGLPLGLVENKVGFVLLSYLLSLIGYLLPVCLCLTTAWLLYAEIKIAPVVLPQHYRLLRPEPGR